MRYSYQTSRQTPIWVLIAVNLFIYIVTLLPSADLGLGNLILHKGTTVQPWHYLGQHPWTIVTSMFVHAGFWHIFGNMLTLFFFGTYLLELVGLRKFLLIYFIGGIVGNVFFVLLAPPLSSVVGASGAIFALGGALAVMRPSLRVFVFPIPAPLPLWIAVVGGFILTSTFAGALTIAWQAHFGGIIVGAVSGYILRRQERPRYFWR